MSDPSSRLIGITMGCPVGIGPELILRFLSEPAVPDRFTPVVLGNSGVLERCARDLGLNPRLMSWQPGRPITPGVIPVFDPSPETTLPDPDRLIWGNPTIETGRAMASYIEKAVNLILKGELAAMVTCPITKSALNAAGYAFPGHTEMIASICGSSDYAMMMAGDKLRVTLVTIHSRLSDVPDLLSISAVTRLIQVTGASLRNDFGIPEPRIAVAGLNPHAGEEGLFGDEEMSIIRPAIDHARSDGWLTFGPFPPDTVFLKAVAGEYDGVVCMYHDQGLIPFKLLHFSDGVNITIGLPIVRTSVDHGTAYDIAGKGIADIESLKAAYRMAGEIVINRRRASY